MLTAAGAQTTAPATADPIAASRHSRNAARPCPASVDFASRTHFPARISAEGAPGAQRPQTVVVATELTDRSVGWVERSETHRTSPRPGQVMGFSALQPMRPKTNVVHSRDIGRTVMEEYYIFEDLERRSGRIHLAHCRCCNSGRSGRDGQAEKWHAPFDRNAAFDAVEALTKGGRVDTQPCEVCNP